MNNDILNFEDGQLYLNLSIQLDGIYPSYVEALEALYSALDYSLFYRKERRGRPYRLHPSKMMVLIIYAYMNGTFSSREIEKLMRRDCVCMKVLGMDGIPDHSFFFLFALPLLMFYNFQKQREFFYGKGIYRGDRSGHH